MPRTAGSARSTTRGTPCPRRRCPTSGSDRGAEPGAWTGPSCSSTTSTASPTTSPTCSTGCSGGRPWCGATTTRPRPRT
ncbi:hypothetical protein [Ornithinimicrobium kibberense]|uniref:hypothetical protein n=1 Tax=Ornithinimicrobium kibberense TaxID=282060 RepID=UPI00361B5E89